MGGRTWPSVPGHGMGTPVHKNILCIWKWWEERFGMLSPQRNWAFETVASVIARIWSCNVSWRDGSRSHGSEVWMVILHHKLHKTFFQKKANIQIPERGHWCLPYFLGEPSRTVRNIQPCISQQRGTHSVFSQPSAARAPHGRKHWETSQPLVYWALTPLFFKHFLFL